MPALFLIGLFSFLMTLMTTVVLQISNSTQEFTQELEQETRDYFLAVRDVVMLDIVPNHYQVVPARATGTNAETAALNLLQDEKIRQLAPPNLQSDPTRDAWGNPIVARMVTDFRDLDAHTRAPVSGILLVSMGPDATLQTVVDATIPDTIAGYGAVDALGDDIVVYFTTDEAIKRIFKQMNSDLESIRQAMLRRFVDMFRGYREDVLSAYQAALVSNPATPAPDFVSLLQGGAPPFTMTSNNPPQIMNVDIDNNYDRRLLGKNDEFERLERVLPGGGRMVVKVVLPYDPIAVTFELRNDIANPSPWSSGPRTTARAEF